MRYVEDITNFTIAEIAFFLLLVILIGYALLAYENTKPLPEPLITGEEIALKDEQLVRQIAEIGKLNKALQDYQQKDKNLKSSQPPTCYETKFYKEFLFTVLIIDADTFQIESAQYSWDKLEIRYREDIDQAFKNGCRHRIKASYVANIKAVELWEALKKIEVYFYVKRLNPNSQ